jgi:hypothetical protein
MERPGEWANIGESYTGVVNKLRKGQLYIPKGKWEFEGRSISPTRITLYAKYLGAAGHSRRALPTIPSTVDWAIPGR